MVWIHSTLRKYLTIASQLSQIIPNHISRSSSPTLDSIILRSSRNNTPQLQAALVNLKQWASDRSTVFDTATLCWRQTHSIESLPQITLRQLDSTNFARWYDCYLQCRNTLPDWKGRTCDPIWKSDNLPNSTRQITNCSHSPRGERVVASSNCERR